MSDCSCLFAYQCIVRYDWVVIRQKRSPTAHYSKVSDIGRSGSEIDRSSTDNGAEDSAVGDPARPDICLAGCSKCLALEAQGAPTQNWEKAGQRGETAIRMGFEGLLL